MLVDKYAHMQRRRALFEPHTFYGWLEHLYVIKFTCTDVRVSPQVLIILSAIRNCKIRDPGPSDLGGLDIHLYSSTGGLDIIDVTSIQALIGRVGYAVDGGGWAVIDQSGSLAHAIWDPTGNSEDEDECPQPT